MCLRDLMHIHRKQVCMFVHAQTQNQQHMAYSDIPINVFNLTMLNIIAILPSN